VKGSPAQGTESSRSKRTTTADSALRLTRATGTPEKLWMGLQAGYDFDEARK